MENKSRKTIEERGKGRGKDKRNNKKKKLHNRVNPKEDWINKLITELRIGYPLVNIDCFMI